MASKATSKTALKQSRPAAKKAVAKKAPVKPAAVPKTAASKAKAAVKKAPAKPVSKAAVKKPAAKKAVVKKPTAPARQPAAQKPVVKKPAAKPVAKKAVVKKPVAKKAAAKEVLAAKPSPWKKPSTPAPVSTVPPVVGLSPWLQRPRELAALEAAIKPRREKPKASVGAGKPVAQKAKKKATPKPVAKKAKAVRVAKAKPTGPAKKAPARRRGLKKVVVVLKAALKLKKPPGPVVEQVLRADYGEGMKGNKDAERLLGVSRQVH